MNMYNESNTSGKFLLGDFLSLLYQHSKPLYNDQQSWFRDLFYRFHCECDELFTIDNYYLAQSTISELLHNAPPKKFPPRMFRFYFSDLDGYERCYQDFRRYLGRVSLTEGRLHRLTSALISQIPSASNIYPKDLAYIMQFEKDGDTAFAKAASLCTRTLIVLAS